MTHISASLLAADYARLGEEIQRAEKAGADSFHFDIMDGHYVPNLALAPDHLKALGRYSSLPFHIHLELDNPDEVLTRFEPFRADTIIVQWDTLSDPGQTFEQIRSRGMKVGLGLCPDDSLDAARSCLSEIDLLLLLGVYPGFGGQALQPGTLEKLATVRAWRNENNHPVTIAVDGGVKPQNAAQLAQAGADVLIMGTALFQSSDMTNIISSIRESIAAAPGR